MTAGVEAQRRRDEQAVDDAFFPPVVGVVVGERPVYVYQGITLQYDDEIPGDRL